MRYIERLAWPAVETEPVVENERRQLEGQIFHRLVQQHLLGIPADRLERLAYPPDLDRWWKNYMSFEFGLRDYTKHTELSLSAPLGQHRLLAKYDLVAIDPGKKAIIFDWKTYLKRPRDEWMAARWQTRVYRAMLVRAAAHLNAGKPFDPGQVEMIYWYADFPSEPARFHYTAAQYKRDWSALEKLTSEITGSSDFRSRMTSRCAASASIAPSAIAEHRPVIWTRPRVRRKPRPPSISTSNRSGK